MDRQNHIPEQIIGKLREAEVHISNGMTVEAAARQIGATCQTYARWEGIWWDAHRAGKTAQGTRMGRSSAC